MLNAEEILAIEQDTVGQQDINGKYWENLDSQHPILEKCENCDQHILYNIFQGNSTTR